MSQKSKARRGLRWILVAVAVAAVGSFVAFRTPKGGAAAKLDKALLARVKRADLEITVLETGRIEPRAQSQIKSRVGGQVLHVTVEEGDKVKVGQVLIKIEPTDHRREVARVEVEVEQMRLQLAQFDRDLERARKARAGQIASAVELEQAENQVALQRARLEGGKVAVATARDRLRYTELEAPIAGTVVQRGIQPGESVVPGAVSTFEGKPLLVIADLSVLLVKVDLNQIDVAKVKKGMAAEISLDALPGKKFKALLTRVAAASSAAAARAAASGPETFPVEAVLASEQDLSEIKPGMTADVKILVETKPKVLLLPIEAVNADGGKHKVFQIQAGAENPLEKEVGVGLRNDREIEIITGLHEGDSVLVQPPAKDEKKR